MYPASDTYYSPTAEYHDEPHAEVKPKVRVLAMTSTKPKRPVKPKIHPCPQCASQEKHKAFNRMPDLHRHISSVHEKKRPYKCQWRGCKKIFSQSSSLVTHKNSHTGEKPWLCGVCKAPFGDQSSCARHQREQHTGLTHFCPYCHSTNKRASDFKGHLSSSHGIQDGSIDLNDYRLPLQTTLDILERLPQFNLPGMTGIEARRKHPQRARIASVSHDVKPMIKISALEREHELIAFPEARGPSPSINYIATPSSTSLSPSPDVGNASYCAQSSPYVGYNNALALDLGANGQRPYSNLHTLSHSLSAASFLSDGRSSASGLSRTSSAASFRSDGSSAPLPLSRTSSASSMTTEYYTPQFSTLPEEMEKAYTYTLDGSTTSGPPYVPDAGGEAHYPAQTMHQPYPQAPYDSEGIQLRRLAHEYLPGGLGISRTARSRAHQATWNSQEWVN